MATGMETGTRAIVGASAGAWVVAGAGVRGVEALVMIPLYKNERATYFFAFTSMRPLAWFLIWGFSRFLVFLSGFTWVSGAWFDETWHWLHGKEEEGREESTDDIYGTW